MNRTILLLAAALAFPFSISPASAITIPTVAVGNPGNAPGQLSTFSNPDHLLFGAVPYSYRIGTTEVTNAQYAEFLNAKAATDPLTLYNTNMASHVQRGGITRSGSDGSYRYTVKTNMGNKPVNWVTWYDAVRFANWLHNGQGTGDTETGAYTLLGGTPTPNSGLSITRNTGAIWFLTSEDEWYKAAYYDPTLSSGAGGYWTYPTQSNSLPSRATASSIGDVSNPGVNIANYNHGADWDSHDGNVTTVGSAGPLSKSYYGTSDQGGNLWEWNEGWETGGVFRGMRGGSFGGSSGSMTASVRSGDGPIAESIGRGFRVATIPEPSTLALGAIGFLAFAVRAWRRKRCCVTALIHS